MKALPKSILVGVGALIISTLGIQASDELAGVSGRLSGLVLESQGVCGLHEVPILFGSHSVCMDVYEASPHTSCPYEQIKSEVDTQVNIGAEACRAHSAPSLDPWKYVTYTEAQQLCARAGKRLPTNEEWYKVALGQTELDACFLSQTLELTGTANCVTNTGVHDVVGNVWEWMDDTVTDGTYKDRSLPESGYITLVDSDGVVLTTHTEPDARFGEDYAWVNSTGVQGIIRGGFYGSGEDGGIFSQNIAVPLNFSAVGVGFRCVRDIL